MDGELPPWNKHGSQNSRVPYNKAEERQEVGYSSYISVHYDKVLTEVNYGERAEEFSHRTWLQKQPKDHDLIGDSFVAEEPMSSLSSCMSGAFKALLPDYHGTSSEMTTSSVKYSCSPNNNCLIKPGTAVDEKTVVERREKSDFLKDPLCEASASVTHMLPPRCAQYVPQEKDQDQGNCNWTSVIKDSLEMSNGMEMEQSLSMDVCGPLMGFNPVYKGPETEAKFTLKDHYQIAGSKLNEKPDGHGVKGEPDSFISMLSDGISKKKDVLEMGENDEQSILDVGTSLGTEELGMTGIRENEPGVLPEFNRSSYTSFPSSEGFMKCEEFLGIPSVKQSVEHTLQGTTQGPKTCKDVSPKKTAGTNICFKHATVNNETVLEGSSVYGLHHLDLQKDFNQAEVTDGNTSINTQDHSFEHDVQDKRVNTSNLPASETTLIEKSGACLPDTQYFGSKLKKQDHDLVPSSASLGSQNPAVVECENSKLQIPTEDRTSESSLSVPEKIKTVFQKTFLNTKNAELGLKVETGSSPEIQNFSSGSETVPDQTVKSNKIHLDYKCKDAQIEPGESDKLNPSTVLLPCDEKVQNSENKFLNITSENSIPPPTENVHAAPPSLTSRLDCSSQPNLQKALQKHKKSRKRKKSELEELIGPIHKSKRDDSSVYGSEISDSAVKPDTIGCEDTNQNFSLTNHDSTSLKEEDLIKNGDVNPPSSRSKSLCHSQLQRTHLELVADTAETSQKTDHSCSETSQVKVPSTTMIDRKTVSRRKLKNKTKLRLKANKSARLGNQCLSQGAVLSSEEDCTSHFQVSEATLLKDRNPAIIQQANIAECSPEKSTKKKTLQTKKYALQTLQSKGDLHDDPTTFSEVEADLMDSNRHQKVRRPGIKASKGKNYEHATSLLNSQSLLESVSQTDSVSTSVTVSSNILRTQKNPKKSRQKRRADINNATNSPQEDIPLPLSKTKGKMISNTRTVKAKISVKKASRTDDCDTTLLDIQPSIATLKQTDYVPTAGIKVESPVVLHTQRKNKLSDVHIPTVDQTKAQQSVLNPLSESDASIVQPTVRRFSPRKTLDTVSENCETAHLNESISSVDSMSATVTDISGVSLMNTEKASSKRRRTNIKFMEEQTSTTSQKGDVIVLPSQDFASIVVSETNVKVKKLARNNTNDTHLNNMFEDTSLLAFVTQENSISPSKIDCSSSVRPTNTLKKPRKKTVTKNEAEEIINIKQLEDFVAITSKPSANKVASSSQMTLKEKGRVENAITEEVKESHATSLFGMQTSTATLQHTECVSTSFAHSTPKKSKKMSEAVHTPEVDQSMQQALHPFDSVSATETDNSDIPNQKKIKVKTKRQSKKVTNRKTRVTQANSSIREQSFPATVQQEYSVSNRNTNSRSEELTKKHKKKKTSTLKVRNVQPEDHAEHPTVLSALWPPLIPMGKDATHDPCIKVDVENESAESHVENEVFNPTEDVACSQSLLKKVKKTQEKQMLVQKEDEQSNILELAHREDKKSDVPSVVRDVAIENFETLEAHSCDQQKKRAKKSKKIEETHEFANVSLSQEKKTGSDETGVMVTFTQIQDFCKLHDGQAIGSQQPEKDEVKEESRIKDLKATKNPKTKSRKAGRKKRIIAGLLTQTVKEEEQKDLSYENRIACDFQNNTQIPISDSSQRTAVIPEEPVIDLGPFVENVSTQGSLDITECHTRLGETLSGSMQPADCEEQYTVEQKSPRRGRPPSIKNKKQKLSIAHLEDDASPSVQISDLSSCQDGTEALSSSMQPADCEGQYTIKQKSPRRGRPPSIKNKKQKLSIPHLEDDASPSVQISDLSSCQDGTETLSSFMQPTDYEGQYTKQKSSRRGRPPSIKTKNQKLSIAHLEDNASPSVQISDLSSCQDGTVTLSSSMQPADCEGQYTIKKKSPRQGRSPSNKSKKHKLSIAHLEDNTSPSVQISDLSSCQDGTLTLSSSMQPADCEGQHTIKQKSPKQRRSPSNKSRKHKLSIAHLEDNASLSVQISDLSSCQDGTVTLSSSMQPTDCEGQYTIKKKSPRQGRSPSNKSKKHKLSIAHLEVNAFPSVQIPDLSSCQDGTSTPSSSKQPADCEGQYTKQKSPRRGRPPSIKNEKQTLSIAHLEDNTSPSVQISDLSSCQDGPETLSSSMQPADCEGQYTIKQKSPRRGRPPSIKNKKQTLSIAHFEDNNSPSVQISDLSSCQDGTEILTSSMQPADCEGQYTIKQKSPRRRRSPSIKNKKQTSSIAHLEDNTSPPFQILDLSSCQDSISSKQPADCEGQYTKQKSPRRGRPPSIKNKKQTLSIAHLEDNSPSVQISDLSSCQDRKETLSSSMQPADCEGRYTKQKSPRRGRPPSIKNEKQTLSIAHLEDNTSPSVQISDLSSCQDGTEILTSSMQPADCEGQYTIKQKSPRRRRSPSIKNKKQTSSIAHLEDNTSPPFQILDLSSCQDSISFKQPADCEGQYTKQKSPRRGRPPSIKNKKQTLSIAHLEDNSPSVQISDLSSCQDSKETLSSSMQPADCEGQYTKQKSPRRGRPPSIKNKKQTLSIAHLEDNTSPSVQISDLSSCQDSTENKVKATTSPVKQKVAQPLIKRKVVKVDNVTVTKQLGTDPSESLQSLTDDLSHNIPVPKHKKGKNFKRLKLSSLRVSSRTSELSVKDFQKADIHFLSQNSTNDFNEEGKTSLPMPGTAKKQKLCEKTAILDGDVLADIKIENKAKVKVVKGGKRGRKRRKIKEPPPDLVTEQEELQRLTTKSKNNKGQDCSEPAKSLLTEFSITNECSTDDQNNIVTSEKKYVKTKLSSVEMIPATTVETCQITPKTEVLCSSSTHLSSNLMKEVKYKEHNAETNGKDLFAVIDLTGISGGVSSGICNLISSNVGKEESENNFFLDTKIKPNIEMKCTQKTDGQSVEMSGEIILDNLSEIENEFQTSTEQKVDGFTQDSEECVVMRTNKRTMRSKPKEMMKKPLTCKYCGVSFRHITAYAIHQRIHTGDKPYKCKNCGKTFAQLCKLKSHRNVHKQDTSFPCPCCSQRFLQKENLLSHFKVHLQESKTNSEPQKDIKSKKKTSTDVCSETPNNYRCLICKKNFVNHLKLQNHMQSHEVEKALTCKDCGKKFWKPSSFAAHEKSHWPVKPYACSICGKGFNQLKALKKHSQDHAGETPFSCFHCGHGFSALSALRMHQASKTCIARRNDGASGNIEGFIVSQGVDGQVNTPVFFKCQICKQLFRKWCQYTLHLQTHTSSPPYICFSCGQCYEKDSEMNVHCEVCCQSSGEEHICGASLSEIMKGVTQTFPLKCTSSQTLPSTGFQLNSQTQTSSEQLPQLPKLMDVEPTQTRHTDFSQLPKTYSTQSPIKLPIAQLPTHSDVNCTSTSSSLECIEITPSLWKFKCSRCGQRFERYRTLSAHLQMHGPGFRYTCGHCGQFFERWSKLWLHQRRHRLKSRCYSCNQCNLQFRFFSSFKEHMIDHAGQRPFSCPLCPKTFLQEASLHAHQCESHKLCKSLKCDVCSKTFSSLTNLIKHSLLHNGSTSHICLPCNLSFTNTRVLKEHLKTHSTYHGPTLPDIPSKPLDFPHKCKRCKASFSTGDLLYAHQIRHSRDPKSHVHPAKAPTSKLSDSCDTPSTPSSTRRNHISNLKLDGIPNDESMYVYSHPDRLYVPHSSRVQIPVINLDPDEQEEVSDSQNTSPEIPTGEITAPSDSTHLPQATAGQETTNLNLSESIKEMENGELDYSRKLSRRTRFVETSVDMEVEMTAQEEESLESFECADCTERLSSVLSLYEHYILHAMGDTYGQVH